MCWSERSLGLLSRGLWKSDTASWGERWSPAMPRHHKDEQIIFLYNFCWFFSFLKKLLPARRSVIFLQFSEALMNLMFCGYLNLWYFLDLWPLWNIWAAKQQSLLSPDRELLCIKMNVIPFIFSLTDFSKKFPCPLCCISSSLQYLKTRDKPWLTSTPIMDQPFCGSTPPFICSPTHVGSLHPHCLKKDTHPSSELLTKQTAGQAPPDTRIGR